jgi:uncharacterized membrane protein
MADGEGPAPFEGSMGGKPFSDDDKIFLFLAYFGLLSLVPFLMFRDKRADPQKEYVYWHARQGLALTLVAACVWVVLMIGMIIPFVNFLVGIVICCWWVFIIVMMIMGWVKAFGGEKWNMPVISGIAEKFN